MSYRVLIVDDSAVLRRMVKRALTISGLPADPVHEASNGQEALGILRENWIDIVFADINMPVMSGAEMLSNMKQDPTLSGTPVVIVSSEHSEKRIEELKALGARAFLVKPFRPETIKGIFVEVLHPGKETHDE
jgi:two-component system, chemotaxis family, chemotaxis protein CheY